jgi:NADPH:quinone reductase-like Zn-dependent oxidoreductase
MVQAKKIVLKKPGNSAFFNIIEFESRRTIEDDQVLIDVHYSGLNFADVMMRLKLYPDAPPAPFTPGYEVSGKVLAVGPKVEGLSVGDDVMGGCYFGGYSSQVTLPSWQVRKVPSSLTLEQAGGLMVSYLTAAFSLFELARVRSDDHVVIDCGSGALGAVLIKLLRHHGVEKITGLSRSEGKLDTIRNLGARAFTHDQWANQNEMADIFINSRGGKTIKTDLKSLAPLGRMVCLGASNMVTNNRVNLIQVISEFIKMEVLGRVSAVNLMNENCGVFGLNVLKLFDQPDKIEKLLSEEFFIPVAPKIDKVFPFDQVAAAHEWLGMGRSSGKILLYWK